MIQIKTFELPADENELNVFINTNHVIVENMTVLQSGVAVVPYDNDPATTECMQIRRGIAAQIGKTISDIYLYRSLIANLKIAAKTGGQSKRTEAMTEIAKHQRAIEREERKIPGLMSVYGTFTDTLRNTMYGKEATEKGGE